MQIAFNQVAKGVEEGDLLSRFVSEAVQEAATSSSRERAAEEGEQKEVVVLFVGIVGFKDRVLHEDPAMLIAGLNRYLEHASRLVRAGRGGIDKFIGEKILAVFTPEDPLHPEEAIGDALRVALRLRHLGSGGDALGPVAVGLVYGPVLSGILGSEDAQREFTVIGDTVNLAARLCELALKQPRGGIILEERMRNLAPEDAIGQNHVHPLATRSVKGKIREVAVFALDPVAQSNYD